MQANHGAFPTRLHFGLGRGAAPLRASRDPLAMPAWRMRASLAMRQNGDLSKQFNLICPVQSSLKKFSASPLAQITSISPAVLSHRGALAIVIDAGRDAVDAAASGACVMAGRGTY